MKQLCESSHRKVIHVRLGALIPDFSRLASRRRGRLGHIAALIRGGLCRTRGGGACPPSQAGLSEPSRQVHDWRLYTAECARLNRTRPVDEWGNLWQLGGFAGGLVRGAGIRGVFSVFATKDPLPASRFLQRQSFPDVSCGASRGLVVKSGAPCPSCLCYS